MKLSIKYAPIVVAQMVGQDHLFEKLQEYMRMDIDDIPNMYMIGTNGIGKSTFARMLSNRCLVDDDDGNLLKLNASDDRGINTIRNKVTAAAKHQSMFGGRRVIWFEEAYKLTNDAQEALKDVIEEYSHVLWIFTTNKPIDKGLFGRCAQLQFRPIPKPDIRDFIEMIIKAEKIKLGDKAIANIIDNCDGSMRKAINLLESPPTINASRELFTKACEDFQAGIDMYQTSLLDAMTFLKESSILVATSTKIKDKKFKKKICISAARHAYMLMMGTPDQAIMNSFLAVINNNWEKIKNE